MAITDWPEGERPRERLLAHGAHTLSDAELLAIYLRVGVRGKTAVDLARDLLQRAQRALKDQRDLRADEIGDIFLVGKKFPAVSAELFFIAVDKFAERFGIATLYFTGDFFVCMFLAHASIDSTRKMKFSSRNLSVLGLAV